ncbi:DUF393 domain-containing protein [Geobacter sp. FeAm09]|uniref:thiol-disulfide oxidoreductase DCC family protein n=1 Tax=Geobacter sp. FeAm09 TaxID=2597769 RepID=UPI0011EBBD4E|nr:DUF393 domain-containing protein [Geobacter sp. FeAm09]QEM68344.1 DUF393 domain-containing protein [Geobacter sp. FeAm09]
MKSDPQFPLRVFYDGSCSVCSSAMARYRAKDRDGRLQFIDISVPEFDPGVYGIPLAEFMYQVHAIDRGNRVYRGVDALGAIWRAFPAATIHGVLAAVIQLPCLKPIARLGYRAFARIRRFLPRQTSACADGACRIGRRMRK